MKKPTISILGRPNVGKSTLFNRLVGKRKSIVSPIEGVTRDRIYGAFSWLEKEYNLIDTGGYIFNSEKIIDKQVNKQAEIATNSSDLIIFIVDGKSEITTNDRNLSKIIKKKGYLYLSTHLLRMIPYRYKVSLEQTIYTIREAIVWLNQI